jgi:hypothetical protein
MTGHVYIGIQVDILASHLHDILFTGQVQVQIFIAEADQVGQCRFISIPVASPVVFQLGNFDSLGLDTLQGDQNPCQQNQKTHLQHHHESFPIFRKSKYIHFFIFNEVNDFIL